MTRQDINKEIGRLGSIVVTFRPTEYDESLISVDDLVPLIERSQIQLRGWSFPHVPINNDDSNQIPSQVSNGHAIEFYTNSGRYIEIHRLYKSGQFLSRMALYEDRLESLEGVWGGKIEPGKYLDIVGITYQVTEIIEFIINLMKNAKIQRGDLKIELKKQEGRKLQVLFNSNIAPLHVDYHCGMDHFSIDRRIDLSKSLDSLEVSRSFLIEMFKKYNWRKVSEDTIKNHQYSLINRQI